MLTIFLVSFALTALGFVIAWPMDSTQAFHGIINLFLIPLWLLSGALFPLSGASGWLRYTAVAVDSTGIYVVGNTTGKLFASNSGGSDAWICKISLAGDKILWSKQLGTMMDGKNIGDNFARGAGD